MMKNRNISIGEFEVEQLEQRLEMGRWSPHSDVCHAPLHLCDQDSDLIIR